MFILFSFFFFILQIYVGLMRFTGDFVRRRSLPLAIQTQWSSEQLLAAALKKHRAFNIEMQDAVHVLLSPDGSEVRSIPGTNNPFTVQKYRGTIEKA